MGSFRELGNGKYRLYVSHGFRADGKPNRTSKVIKASSKRAAQKALNELELSFRNKPPQINSKISFKEFSNIWKERHEKLLSPNTQRGDLSNLKNWLLPYFSNIQLKKITVDDVEKFINELTIKSERLDNRKGVLSPGSIYHIYKLLCSILNKAVEWKYITSNPCYELSKNKRPKKDFGTPGIMGYYELKEFLQKLFALNDNATNAKHKLFFYLSLIDGGRLGEHVALTWNDIDFKKHKLTISKGVYEENRVTKVKSTKSKKSRVVYFDDIAEELFKKHKDYQDKWLKKNGLTNPNQYVFLKTRLKRTEMPTRSMFGHWLDSFLKRNNMEHIGVHGFRRMAGSYAISAHVPITTVRDMLGHANISTTNGYLRYIDKDMKEGTEKMSSIFHSMINEAK